MAIANSFDDVRFPLTSLQFQDAAIASVSMWSIPQATFAVSGRQQAR